MEKVMNTRMYVGPNRKNRERSQFLWPGLPIAISKIDGSDAGGS